MLYDGRPIRLLGLSTRAEIAKLLHQLQRGIRTSRERSSSATSSSGQRPQTRMFALPIGILANLQPARAAGACRHSTGAANCWGLPVGPKPPSELVSSYRLFRS
jgi:hypothetical protein